MKNLKVISHVFSNYIGQLERRALVNNILLTCLKLLYWLRNIAVAIHISKNEDIDRTSNTVDNDSVNGNPAMFVTYEVMGYGFTSGNAEVEK
jgi:hypothetical protein